MHIKKSILFLHRWAGLLSGSIFLIVSLSGAVYVFETEIFGLFHRKLLRVEPTGAAMVPATRILASAQAALGPDLSPGWIEGFGPEESIQVSAYKRDDSAAGIWYWDQLKAWKTAYVNPYTGTTLGVVDRRFEFFQVTRQVHQNLLLRYDYGHWIVGVTVLVFVWMLITGLVLWLPRNRAALKQRLKVAWGAGRRRLQFDLHVVSGIYVWIPVFIIAATGLTWSFGWWGAGINFLVSGKTGDPWAEAPTVASVPPGAKPDSSEASIPVGPLPLDLAFAEAKRLARPGGGYSVGLPKDSAGVYEASYQEAVATGWHSWSTVKFDQYSGRVLYTETFRDQDIRKKLSYSNYDIHIGKILGWPTQILAFLTCLLCASLPVTGFMMWLGKKRR